MDINTLKENSDILGKGSFSTVYKVKNPKTNEFFALKEIDISKRPKTKIEDEIRIMKSMNSENSVSFINSISTKKYFYIIMEYCEFTLEQYIQRRQNPFSVSEIKYLLNQLNNAFKIMNEKKIIHRDLKPSNILISLKQIDKCLIKITDYGSSNFQDDMTGETTDHTPLYSSPELLNGEIINSKIDIWSLGIIIYYLLNKEHPYTGKTEVLILNNIKSGKKLKLSDDDLLNDLIIKMLKFNVSERISWDEYFNHPFFKENNDVGNSNFKIPFFNFNCDKHSKVFNNYCVDCKKNICNKCLKEHLSHQIIPFNEIGLKKDEIDKMENIFKEIDENIISFNKIKENIENLLLKMKLIQEKESVYDNDIKNNYKEYYLNYLEMINNNIKKNNIKYDEITLINLSKIKHKNEIICTYDIEKEDENIQILNSYEEILKKYEKYSVWDFNGTSENENELKKCDIFINDKRIPFCYEYKFPKKGKYTIKFEFYEPLTNTNFMFDECNKIISIDLSNFNSKKIRNMSYMFSNCSSLKNINLSNFNTENVNNMDSMFSNCSSLKNINLSNFNTENVNNMSYMFNNCSSLEELDLSNFNTRNVNNMVYMFTYCSSLKKLKISKLFDTSKIEDMSYMFSDCYSLEELDLSNFKTENVNNMENMFLNCSSLKNINLSKFNVENVNNMSYMFNNCSSLEDLDLSNFITENVNNMESMFSNCSSLKNINLSKFKTKKVENMNCLFNNCSSLQSLELDNFKTNKVYQMDKMFQNCSSLKTLSFINFNIDKVYNLNNVFFGCDSLEFLYINNFRINNGIKWEDLFYGLNEDCYIDCCDETFKREKKN